MAQATVMTAQLKCSFGLAPSALTVLPVNRVNCGKQIAANIMDSKPMLNILPFGMCITPTNPVVASATAAAAGGVDADAVHPEHGGALGAGVSHGDGGGCADAEQHVQLPVRVGGRDHHRDAGAGDDQHRVSLVAAGG